MINNEMFANVKHVYFLDLYTIKANKRSKPIVGLSQFNAKIRESA